MIGLVVVSHSRALAEAAVALACDMVDAGRRPRIEVAAGLDDGSFGTDAAAVAEAISAADSPDGVAVLVDLGSAVLSAEMALEFVDAEVAGRVRLSPAPLVEGLVAAVVTAATGASVDAVLAEAAAGLSAKQQHLGGSSPSGSPSGQTLPLQEEHLDGGGAPGPAGTTEVVELPVDAALGMHARPAARLVGLVLESDVDVTLTNLRTGQGPVDAGSMASVIALDVRKGDRVRCEASGPGAAEVLDALQKLADDNWGDAES